MTLDSVATLTDQILEMRPTGLSASADLILASDDPHGAGRARDEARGQRVSAQRCNELRLTGSGGANRVMEAELKRLVMRSPFGVRLEKPKREGEATLLYPFEACIAWVAACHHRTSSRISWDLCSSTAVRLEPLFDDLLPALSSDDRLPGGASLRFSVEVGPSFDFEASPLQLRGVVKNAIVETLASRRVASEVDADSPDVVFVVRRAGTPGARRTVIGIDIGGGARHRRGARVAGGPAPLRETMAAQLIILSRWDARTEPLVDPMAGGATIAIEAAGLATGAAIRRPSDLPLRHLAAFKDLPREAPDLFPGTVPQIVALDADPETIPAMVGNLRAAGLTGRPIRRLNRHRATRRSRADARRHRAHAARRARHEAGRLLLQPAVWSAHRRGARRRGSCSRSTLTWAAPSRASAAGARPVSSRTRTSWRPSATHQP